MKNRLFLNMLVLCMMLTLLTAAAFAAETDETAAPTQIVRADDECGASLNWSFADGILTITGSGEMDDFADAAPWDAHKDDITEVRIEGDVTYIGARAFRDYDALETVDFGQKLHEIGTDAFASCDGLTAIELPSSFKVFGEGCFQSCKNLKQIHCSGRFPSFRQNCLWATYVTIYYPASSPWNTETIQQLEEAFHSRVEFLASDGTDHYEPTEEPTEPEETVPETTVPETEPPVETAPPATVPQETQAPTEPVPTEPAKLPTETAETAPTQEETEPEEGGISTGMIIILTVLGLLALGAIVFGRKNRRRGKYSR